MIARLSEGLLAHYAAAPLIDQYDIYQHLMDYWAETMQDDCYLIAADGWKAETTRIVETDKKGKERDKGWTCDLVPKPLIVARYYAKEQAVIDQLAVELEAVTAKLAEMEEEHGGEDGAFADFDKVNKADKTSLPGQVVLVMQGGGAPGCYQAGAYQALHEAGIEPDWVIGTSIGAINGAIIAGNQVADRVVRLRDFWAHLEPPSLWPLSELAPVTTGVPGFYYLNPALAWGVDAEVGIEQAAMYLVDPLKRLLPGVIDFNLINSGMTRFTLGLTTVRTGRMRYFDCKKDKIGLEHVLGSSAIPPCFPAVRIDGEYYWDGGVYSNSPVEVIFDEYPRQSSVVFGVQIWPTRGPEPKSLAHAFMREKDILFGSRSRGHIMRQAELHRMRRIIRELVDMLPISTEPLRLHPTSTFRRSEPIAVRRGPQ